MAPKAAVNKTVKGTNDGAKISSIENQGGAGLTPRPTDEAAEPANKRNRAETEAEKGKRAVYEAVTAAFLERLPGKQFEGNARAQESLSQFIDDCEQGKETEELDYRAHLTVMSLAPEYMSKRRDIFSLTAEQEMKLIVIAAVEAGTGIKRNSLFDACSVDFPLGGSEKVKVLVPYCKSNDDNPLYRHLEVAAFQPDDARRVASAITPPDGPLPLFYGASGSGKTTCGSSPPLAENLGRAFGCCAVLTASHSSLEMRRTSRICRSSKAKVRNASSPCVLSRQSTKSRGRKLRWNETSSLSISYSRQSEE
jgi:hypothetical protein